MVSRYGQLDDEVASVAMVDALRFFPVDGSPFEDKVAGSELAMEVILQPTVNVFDRGRWKSSHNLGGNVLEM